MLVLSKRGMVVKMMFNWADRLPCSFSIQLSFLPSLETVTMTMAKTMMD